MSPEARARLIDSEPDLAAALAIREEVFVLGQDVPRELEVDGLDPVATHFLAEVKSEDGRWVPAGAARMRRKDGKAKAERVAVLEPHRKRGLGVLLMAAIEEEARHQGMAEVILNAQSYVVPFYERLGYHCVGPEFEEAGIPHQAMRKRLG